MYSYIAPWTVKLQKRSKRSNTCTEVEIWPSYYYWSLFCDIQIIVLWKFGSVTWLLQWFSCMSEINDRNSHVFMSRLLFMLTWCCPIQRFNPRITKARGGYHPPLYFLNGIIVPGGFFRIASVYLLDVGENILKNSHPSYCLVPCCAFLPMHPHNSRRHKPWTPLWWLRRQDVKKDLTGQTGTGTDMESEGCILIVLT